MGLLFLFDGGQEHVHVAALQLGLLFDGSKLAALFREALEQLQTDGRMGDFAAAEADGHLDLVAALEESARMPNLDVQVVDIDAGGQADLLDLHHALVFARLFLALGLLKAELAVVHDAADRRLGLRRDLDEVHTALNGDLKRLLRGHDAELLAARVDQADFLVADFFVDLMFHAANSERTS